uniref:Transposase n=1 Tax=Mesocestoides corti TaxID=53468 RepID=A0A5K3G3W3_MESCO
MPLDRSKTEDWMRPVSKMSATSGVATVEFRPMCPVLPLVRSAALQWRQKLVSRLGHSPRRVIQCPGDATQPEVAQPVT